MQLLADARALIIIWNYPEARPVFAQWNCSIRENKRKKWSANGAHIA